jgi:hypothetical protein
VIWILRFDHTPAGQTHIWQATSIHVDPQTGIPSDMSFYNNDSIAVLREHDSEGFFFFFNPKKSYVTLRNLLLSKAKHYYARKTFHLLSFLERKSEQEIAGGGGSALNTFYIS